MNRKYSQAHREDTKVSESQMDIGKAHISSDFLLYFLKFNSSTPYVSKVTKS